MADKVEFPLLSVRGWAPTGFKEPVASRRGLTPPVRQVGGISAQVLGIGPGATLPWFMFWIGRAGEAM